MITKMQPGLTVLIPTYNEEQNISACIESVGNLTDDVVVVDSQSTDKTVDLARSMKARILTRKFDNYADQKNWALDQLDAPWVLILDADERITASLREEIRLVLQTDPPCAGYWIRRETFFAGRHVRCWSGGTVLRLFERSKGRYEAGKPVHENLLVNGKEGRLSAHLEHYTFRSWSQYLVKVDAFTSLAAGEAYEKGKRTSISQLLVYPPLHFLKMYVAKRGFLDGTPGVLIAWLTAYTTYLKNAKLWEMQTAGRPDGSR